MSGSVDLIRAKVHELRDKVDEHERSASAALASRHSSVVSGAANGRRYQDEMWDRAQTLKGLAHFYRGILLILEPVLEACEPDPVSVSEESAARMLQLAIEQGSSLKLIRTLESGGALVVLFDDTLTFVSPEQSALFGQDVA